MSGATNCIWRSSRLFSGTSKRFPRTTIRTIFSYGSKRSDIGEAAIIMRPAFQPGEHLAQTATRPEFKPYIADEQQLPELTMRALILGAALGIVFGASSVYLGLKVGLTVSASIPVAVISIT